MSSPIVNAYTLSSLGFNPDELGINGDPALIQLNGYGLYQVDNHVLQVGDPLSRRKALEQVAQSTEEHGLIEHYLGSRLAQTAFIGVDSSVTGMTHLVQVQEFVRGIPLSVHSGTRERIIRPLLADSVRMYEETGKMPNLAGAKDGYSPLKSSGVLVDSKSKVKLIRPTFSKPQRTFLTGRAVNATLAAKAREILEL